MFLHKAVALAKKLLPWQKHLYKRFESYLLKYVPYMLSMLSSSVLANKISNGISYCKYRSSYLPRDSSYPPHTVQCTLDCRNDMEKHTLF